MYDVSFSTWEICKDDSVDCYLANDIGMTMQQSLDGQDFTSNVSIKSKCKNFTVLKKTVKINKKQVILSTYTFSKECPWQPNEFYL